jgi:hypothetical protein
MLSNLQLSVTLTRKLLKTALLWRLSGWAQEWMLPILWLMGAGVDVAHLVADGDLNFHDHTLPVPDDGHLLPVVDGDAVQHDAVEGTVLLELLDRSFLDLCNHINLLHHLLHQCLGHLCTIQKVQTDQPCPAQPWQSAPSDEGLVI